MEFFSNKKNETLKFKINSEGIDVNVVEPRLVLVTKENKNYIFLGKINEGVCEFKVPELEQYTKGNHGIVRFEIISEDLYFPVWEEKFEIKTKSTIKIDEAYTQIKEASKPNISSVMLDSDETNVDDEPIIKNTMKPIMESLEDDEPIKQVVEPIVEQIIESSEPIVESIKEEESSEPIVENVKEDIKQFMDFKTFFSK